MSNSLRDQLLQLGFKTPPAPEPRPSRAGGKPGSPAPSGEGKRAPSQRPQGGPGGRPDARGQRKGGPDKRADPARKPSAPKPRRSQEEIDLGKAYALRAQKEKDERIAAEREKQEAARLRREARARLLEFIRDKGLNDANAEIARHFEYGGKIKRIYVNEAQLKSLNAGELGVLQVEGRYVLVTAAVLVEAEAIFAQAVALRVDPNATAADDPYADPQYRVPDDLVW
jgi:uncharacterized protein YaiL (DUF2058 family)